MKIQAHRIDKIAEKASFMTNELFEYLLDDIDAIYSNQDGIEFFVWPEKEDMDELEELLEKYRAGEDEDDEEEELNEDEIEFETEPVKFTDRDFKRTKEIIRTIRKDLENQKRVMYIVW